MPLNRVLIKQQARQLIKNNVWKLFIISIVVGMLCGTSLQYTDELQKLLPDKLQNNTSYSDFNYKDYSKIYGENNTKDYGKDHFSDFGNSSNSSDNSSSSQENNSDYFSNFGNNSNSNNEKIDSFFNSNPISKATTYVSTSVSVATSFFLSTLTVGLAYLYLLFIRGQRFKCGEGFKVVFKIGFSKNYLNILLMHLFKDILVSIGACAISGIGIIIGHIVGYDTVLAAIIVAVAVFVAALFALYFHYRFLFADYLMADSGVKAKKALELSTRLTKNHIGELFVLDLSFVWWYALCGITFGIALIYVLPYLVTTQTLYYQNFMNRAHQEGLISDEDFTGDNIYNDYHPVNPLIQAPPVIYQQNPQQGFNMAASETSYYVKENTPQEDSTSYYNNQPTYYKSPEKTVNSDDVVYNPPEYQNHNEDIPDDVYDPSRSYFEEITQNDEDYFNNQY